MSEGYVCQIFSSIQGEGPYVGRRQIFVRFAGCNLSCIYCDTPEYRAFCPKTCAIEVRAGSSNLKRVQNPLNHKTVIQYIKRLMTADVHSISLTGGEPLVAGDFLIDVARSCKDAGWATYLETNGANKRAMEKVVPHLDFAAIDIKLPDHEAMPHADWKRLYEEEISCLKIALEKGVKSFVKIVVLKSSRIDIFRKVCEKLADIGSPQLVIQPVTPAGKIRTTPHMDQVLKFSETAAKSGLREVMIIPQVHKLMGVL